jgi:uncharacterized membrane protein YgdD (TMEM256/DUF423 family)
MHKTYLISGAVFGCLAVALGAFGAHGLQNITSDEKIIRGFQTAVQYQMYHALALLAVEIIYEKIQTKLVRWSGNFFIIGIFLFSGSLYIITILKTSGVTVSKTIGFITPIGGIFFIAGWLLLLIALIQYKR